MKIGVFICHCGTNIAGTVNVPQVVEAARKMPMVAYAEDNRYTCSDPGQASIREAIQKHHLDRVVVASCSPRMHETTFRRTVAAAGLNPYLLEMANIREQCSWVHTDKEAATSKAIEIVRMAVAKVRRDEALFPKQVGITKRALVIGAGIAGMQTALDIGGAGYQVVLVEREPSIGGRMAQLDKTFPTLDCSACILTPKMVDVARQPNISLLTYSELESIEGFIGNFKARIRKKARYVDEIKCTGCGECARACPVAMSSEFELALAERKAAYVPFPQAVPNVYTIDKRGYPACRVTCPAGVNAQGYVALISQGKFKEALEVVRRTMPFAAVCGRICTHPCEGECERGKVDQPVAIRSLKRFLADYELKVGREKPTPIATTKEANVAVIGSGPAGLACAYDLTKTGYPVTVFEAAPKAGGLLRYGIPEYRLPESTLDNEISYIEELGVQIRTNAPVKDLGDIFNEGYKAIFLATGAGLSRKMGIPNEDTDGVVHAIDFLRQVNAGVELNLGGRVVVVGGGNAAVDAARVAHRLGAKEVSIVYRRSRAEMPAVATEIDEAEREGVKIHILAAPVRILSKDGQLAGMECIRMELGEPDASGRRRPVPIKGSEFFMAVDNVIIAVGQAVDRTTLPPWLEYTSWGTLVVDPTTLQTNIDGVFAGGDVVSGPADVIAAIAAGKEAAISIQRYLEGMELTEGRAPEIERVKEVPKEGVETQKRKAMPLLDLEKRRSFDEVELGFDEKTAIEEAKRCLNCGGCSECMECVKACEAKAINHEMQDEHIELDIGAIVMATGYHFPALNNYEVYGGGKYPDVISGLQLERLLSSYGPSGGEVVRPSDGTHPKTVVFIGCVGSRDEKTGNGYCSRVCCMYMAKHAIMLREHDPEVKSYIFYPTVRGPGGKMFEDFLVRAQEGAGAIYLRGEINEVYQEDKKIMVCGRDLEKDETVKIPADLVVLAVGMTPSIGTTDTARALNISYDDRHFILEAHPKLRPVETTTDGVFLAGTCLAPFDIPESVAQGGAAAAQVVTLFSHDTLSTEPMVAAVDSMKCVGCLLCADVCPFNAMESQVLRDGRTVAVVNESVCKGCGLCVAACRSQAVGLRGFSPQQVLSEVMALWQ